MEDGLGNVPEISVERKKIMADIDTEIKLACKNLFRSLVGCYPESFSEMFHGLLYKGFDS